MSPVTRLLSGLSGVRQTRPGRWSACCPSHEDRRPSLSIRELDDGTVLVRCWAGCAVDAVVAALGMRLQDLFPGRDRTPGAGASAERRPWHPGDLLRLAAHESTVVAISTGDLLRGQPIDRERLVTAASTLVALAEVAHAYR